MRHAFSLIEILVALAVITTLALPFVEMMATGKKKIEGLPRRLCALYYAQDLMEERLSQKTYAGCRSISKRRISEFAWIRDNVAQISASEVGERRARIRGSLDFLKAFFAEVVITEEIPNRRKRVQVVVSWDEAGHEQNVKLESVLEV